MGDRAHVYVHHGDMPGVYLYTHWGAQRLPTVVRDALAHGARWDDPSYLTRIVVREMIRGSEDESTGVGISAQGDDFGDGGRVVDVDTKQQTVVLCHRWPDPVGLADAVSIGEYAARTGPVSWPLP